MLAKPWLPDKFQSSEIQDLEGKNKLLEKRVYELESYTGDNSNLIKEIEELRTGNQILEDSVNGLRERLDNTTDDTQLRRELEELRVNNQRLRDANREINSKLERITEQYSSLKNNFSTLREKCAGLQDNYKKLTERVEEYNSLQNEWREIIASPNLLSLHRNIIAVVGGDFYKRMFETPISLE
jgi:chromosome segregation ATPase